VKHYIGTKQIQAEPMTQGDYHLHRDWSLPAEKDADAPGYLVKYPDGYISWSPAAQFEAAYQGLDAMSFGHAVEMMKAGRKVARSGWNGKGMWVAITKGNPELEVNCFWNPHAKQHADTLTMKTADGSFLMGWKASQADILVNDWMVID
tara:strand:- start:750 stop:1196 length:447 start_codon:yes stop_codon:yes gene_type:complete